MRVINGEERSCDKCKDGYPQHELRLTFISNPNFNWLEIGHSVFVCDECRIKIIEFCKTDGTFAEQYQKLREQNERYRSALENYLQLLDSGWDFLDDENSLASIAREALKEVTDEK